MSRKRIAKFKKLLEFQTKRVDLIKLQVAAQQLQVSRLQQHTAGWMAELRKVETQTSVGSCLLMFYQQSELAMIELQRQIKVNGIAIAAAAEKLDHLHRHWREQDKKQKSWEKLVEQEAKKIKAASLLSEMQQADERYLSTQKSGDKT